MTKRDGASRGLRPNQHRRHVWQRFARGLFAQSQPAVDAAKGYRILAKMMRCSR